MSRLMAGSPAPIPFKFITAAARFRSRKRARAALSVCAMFVNGMVGGYGTLMSDGYPTAARDRAERAGEYRTRGRRIRAGGGRRAGRALLAPDGDRAARRPLRARHGRDTVPEPRAQGRRTRMMKRGARPGARASLRAPALGIPDHSRGQVIRSG
ncbi:hypothetical protein EMIT0158MI4_150094 [Burkholderia ambifaria]